MPALAIAFPSCSRTGRGNSKKGIPLQKTVSPLGVKAFFRRATSNVRPPGSQQARVFHHR
jgi:hypothetical protein